MKNILVQVHNIEKFNKLINVNVSYLSKHYWTNPAMHKLRILLTSKAYNAQDQQLGYTYKV
jgi:hypothetical protein